MQVLLSKDYTFVQSLGEISKDLNSLAFTLLKIFRQASKEDHEEIQLIKTITSRELNNRGSSHFNLYTVSHKNSDTQS